MSTISSTTLSTGAISPSFTTGPIVIEPTDPAPTDPAGPEAPPTKVTIGHAYGRDDLGLYGPGGKSRSGLADGTNPGQGAGRVNSPNEGTLNPNQAGKV